MDDWFISAQEIRQPMLDANATVEWTPAFYQKRMDDWLRNMGDWNISRKLLRAAAAVLPVRVRAPDGDRLTGGARAARCAGSATCASCTGRGSTTSSSPARNAGKSSADPGGRRVRGSMRIVPLSTLGWDNEQGSISGGYATGAAED